MNASRWLWGVICAAGCVRAAAAPIDAVPAPVPVPAPRADGRLPADVRPTRYALDLVIDPAQATYTGRVRIGVTLQNPASAIVMHGRAIEVRRAVLHAASGDRPAQAALRAASGSKGEAEELTLAFSTTLPAGEAEIEIEFQSSFADGLRGLYRVADAGTWYAYTQFEPNDARRAFPCFDEPGWKTPFDLTVTVPKGSLAVANMPERGRRPSGDGAQVRFEFERSPPLPTYLVALAVGPFDILPGPAHPVPARLIATRGKAALGRLSLDTALAHLALLADYFDRPYPYPKLDLVAVPSFGAGAMENPGLLTFREELLLLDPARTSRAARRSMASVVAHELAHQWFGDLVTMAWWDDLWLNEAFASFMSDKIVDAWKPDTNARLLALAAKSQVMAEDALVSARRIRNPVRSTGQALEAFDAITYAKGRAVLVMIEGWLGPERFRAGLRRYLRAHEWGNATAGDLYAALAEASGVREVAEVMDTFTSQTGVPLVAARCAAGAAGTSVVQLRQREYLTVDRVHARAGQDSHKLWRIPVCVADARAEGSGQRCALLAKEQGRIVLGESDARPGPCPELHYPNVGETGYYRVALQRQDLSRLRAAGLARLPETARFGVVSNAWSGVWTGALPAVEVLDLFAALPEEESRLVWTPVVDALQVFDRALVAGAARDAFARRVRELLGPAARRLAFSDAPADSDETVLLREMILGALGALGEDQATLAEAGRLAAAWLADPQAITADLARVALPLAARHGDAAMFERLVHALRAAPTPEIRLLALAGLTAFEDPPLTERTLGLTLDGTIRAQDLRYLLPGMGMRRATRDVTMTWIQAHFDQLATVMPRFLIGRLVRVTAGLCDETRVRQAEAFFAPRIAAIEGTEKDLRQSVEDGLRCAALARRQRAPTSAWLARGPR